MSMRLLLKKRTIEQGGTTSPSEGAVANEEAPPDDMAITNAVHEDDDLATPVANEFPEQFEIQHQPRFVPLPPEDYEPSPARPFRDPAMSAQNKLPFMTPIAERTESSLAPSTAFTASGYFGSKTPSRSKYDSPSKLAVDDLLLSSPQPQAATPTSGTPAKRKYSDIGATDEELISCSPQKKIIGDNTELASLPAVFSIAEDDDAVFQSPAPPSKSHTDGRSPLTTIHKGPVIPDIQCNPCDDAVRQQILSLVSPPLPTQKGYYDHSSLTSGRYSVLKSFTDKQAKLKAKASSRKSQVEKTVTKGVPPILKFEDTSRVYAVKRELGEGAFAPVYLVDSYDPNEAQEPDENEKENSSPPSINNAAAGRKQLEALKAECPPGTLVWEFHVLRTVKHRLGSAARTMQSIILAHECHLYRDEAFIVLSYSPRGTLLDLVNAARNENVMQSSES